MEKKESWFGKNLWILPFVFGLLAFVGLALPLVGAHTVTYNPDTWEFAEGPRADFGVGMLFGLEGAVVWPYWLLYGLVLTSCVLLLVGFFVKKIELFASIAMFLFLVAGVLFFLSNSLYGFFNAISTVGQYKDAFRDATNPDAYFSNYYWYIKSYVGIADGRLGSGAILSGALSALGCFTAFSFVTTKNRLDIRSMTEIAMLSAIAIVLDVIFHYIPSLPGQVGSLSIALVPIFLIALRHGPAKGFLAASFIYGLITCFTDGYGLWLYPLDYFVAYSGVALIGFFSPFILGKGQKTYNAKGIIFILIGCLLAGIVRMFGSCASSIVNYGYTLSAAFIANLYAIASAFVCALVLIAFYGPLLRLNYHFPVRPQLQDEEEK